MNKSSLIESMMQLSGLTKTDTLFINIVGDTSNSLNTTIEENKNYVIIGVVILLAVIVFFWYNKKKKKQNQ